MKTSSAKMPTLTVSAYLLVHEPVVVAPNQITLPLGPLAAAMSPTISIRNSGTNSMALSDASVNVPGAEVRVQEIQPGRLFSMAVNFPAGFQIKPDQKVEVTVKSNHPKFPLITVPVIQPQLSAVPVRTQRGSSQVQVVSDKAASPVAAGKSPRGTRPGNRSFRRSDSRFVQSEVASRLVK